ncbi:glycoside hydrolase family 76 protein [Favolaschia claudopus]|uniref:Glycoside hydrolase family 76 protein n=1 Tax=Favolaschia claudopus TaxID=2862362 RepID=A0AAW0CIZ9_9AGAR
MQFLPLLLSLYFLSSCRAGPLALPSWRKPNITTSVADRISLADAAVEKAISMLDSNATFTGNSLGYAAQLFSQMAELDTATNRTNYPDTLKDFFLKAPYRANNFSDILSYGHAAVKAYAAYNDPVFRNYAIQSWYFGRAYTLSASQVAAGKTSVKNMSIAKECHERSMSGGTYWVRHLPLSHTYTNSLCDGIATLGTGLSALLAESTPDSAERTMYLAAADDSAGFLQANLITGNSQVQDQIASAANASCASNSDAVTPNPGLVMEGLAVLYSITKDPAIQNLLSRIVSATIPNQVWQQPDGVLTFGDVYLMRSLATLYERNSTPEYQDDIAQYIGVQFNAVVDLATTNGTNIYSNSWPGPPSSAFYPTNQSNAIAAFIGAITISNPPNSSTTSMPLPSSMLLPSPSGSPAMTPSPPQQSKSSKKTVAIIASILATIALMTCVLLIWFIRRRQSRSNSGSSSSPSVSPFGAWRNIRRPGKHARDAPGGGGSGPPPASETRAGARVPPRPPQPAVVATNSASEGSSSAASPPSDLPTEELVRILNERLRGHNWDEDETPPNYPS